MTDEDKIDSLRRIADENNWAFRDDYSGRSMYGKCCPGITTDDAIACIEEAAESGVKGAHMDSMGRSTIVYWPGIKIIPEKKEENDE